MQIIVLNIVTLWLKAKIEEPEEAAVASQWPANKFLCQQTCRPSLGNNLLNMPHTEEPTGISVVYVVCAQAI
jgi:hypothetical protein